MHLTVLGGSAAGPNPGQGCSGYLVSGGATSVVLDLGPGTLPELRRHTDFRALDGVILSHLHLDHMLDVLTLRFALAYNPVSPLRPLPLWVPPGGAAYFEGLALALAGSEFASSYFNVFQMQEYDPNQPLVIGELRVQFRPTEHYVACWAMRVSVGDGADLFYTADTGPQADLIDLARGSAVIIAEGTDDPGAVTHDGFRGHMTSAEAGLFARRARAETLVLSHLWMERDPIRAQGDAAAAFGGPVLLGVPGLHLAFGSAAIEAPEP